MYRVAGTRTLARLTRGLRQPTHSFLRSIHNDGSNSFHVLSVPTSLGITHPGIDMTGAAGYEIEADDEDIIITRKNMGDALSARARAFSNRRLAQFAERQAHLTPEQLQSAEGYLWMGRNMACTWSNDVWEDILDESNAGIKGGDGEKLSGVAEKVEEVTAKRRYSGGQVTRMRKLRVAKKAREENNRKKRGPTRKKKNQFDEECG